MREGDIPGQDGSLKAMADRLRRSGDRRHAVWTIPTPPRGAVRKGLTVVGSQADRRMPRLRHSLVRGLTIFVFHEITDSPSSFQRRTGSATSPDTFREQVLWLSERFTVVEPTALKQFGGSGELPVDAALITFDDSWAGVFRIGLPMLESLDMPALCFLNMATVLGDPDLSAVRAYEALNPPSGGAMLDRPHDKDSAAATLEEIRCRYGADADFASFQGPTATPDDVARAATATQHVWFGSHLFHHWDLRLTKPDLYEQSLRENADALSAYPNALPAFATPHGYAGRDNPWALAVPRELGHRLVLIGTGRQNRVSDSFVLDRLALSGDRSTWRDWWWSAHRGRLLGSLIG